MLTTEVNGCNKPIGSIVSVRRNPHIVFKERNLTQDWSVICKNDTPMWGLTYRIVL